MNLFNSRLVATTCKSTDFAAIVYELLLLLPSKHAGSAPQVFWLWPAPSQNMATSYMPDPTCGIRLGSFFLKKARIKLCKTGPDPIRVAWSGFGPTHLVVKQAGVQESTGPVLG